MARLADAATDLLFGLIAMHNDLVAAGGDSRRTQGAWGFGGADLGRRPGCGGGPFGRAARLDRITFRRVHQAS